MSIDDVLSGKAQFAVVCGDAMAVMATLPDGCAAVSYTDPPYGLSAQSTENIVECLTTWLAGGVYTHGSVRKGKQNCAANIIADSVIDNTGDAESDAGQVRITLHIESSLLGGMMGPPINLHDNATLREEEVDGHRPALPLEHLLMDEGDAHLLQPFDDCEFRLRKLDGYAGCVGPCSCFTLTSPSVFRADVWYGGVGQAEASTGVVALTGAERRAVLTLDIAGGTATVTPAEGTRDDLPRLQLSGSVVVGALAGTGCLSPELQSALVSGVRHAADRTRPLNSVVDTPRDAAADSGAVVDVGLGRVEGATARCTLLLHGDVLSRLTSPIKSKGGMMGHSWDAFVPGPEAWREVHRCLRPGGYCVAFSSTRTVDLLGIAVRLAGFDVRPGWAWVQGGGFPKSLNVSIACDRDAGEVRDVVGVRESFRPNTQPMRDPSGFQDRSSGNVTVPSSPAAVQWDGYGTDVKPAFEPLIVARKALEGTVAHNVQAHGCGALNIDAARIGSESTQRSVNIHGVLQHGGQNHRPSHDATPVHRTTGSTLGRFPAALALVHDEGCVCEGTRRVAGDTAVREPRKPHEAWRVMEGRVDRPEHHGNRATHTDPDGMESIDAWTCTATCAVAELGRQSGESESTDNARHCSAKPVSASKGAEYNRVGYGHADAGTAARFFYQAKASSSDRLAYITCTAGCAHHDSVAFQKDARDSARDPSREQPHGLCRACNGVRTHYGHPTVKPLALAAYHARLLSLPPHTRPIALVPFCGTGIEARALLDVGFRVIAIDLDPRHCAMTTFRLTHKEPEHVTEERAAVTEAERGDWTKPIRVSEVAVKAPVPSVRKEQLPLFGAK